MDTLRVLITDDEQGMRLGVSRILRRFEVNVPDADARATFQIDEADCGEAALAKIHEKAPDILILDHKMPGLSGLDVLDQLQHRQDILVIMITAYASIETAVQAIKRGAYDFLAKPFTPDELRNTIRKAAVRLVLAKQARRLADERNEVRRQFMQMLSHELQAPLNALDGYLDIMDRAIKGDSLAAYGQMIHRSQERISGMRKLIGDLLDMTQIESKQRPRDHDEIDLREVARNACETVATMADKKNIAVNLHASQPLVMTGDVSELEMLLNNLVSNAVKYNRPGGEVHVTLDRNGNTVTISVADTGIGIDLEEGEQLFDEFVRVKGVATRDIPGSGLGLSIVRKIAHAYGGDVTVHSEPGEGSTFTVILNDLSPVSGVTPLIVA
jgi:two-component system sensor histidine kinase/response regulator